jgi:hypothetical protein
MPALRTASPVLVTERGGPVPPTEILAAIKRIAPELNLRFMPNFDRSQWAFTWEWPLRDPRWQWVQNGQADPQMAFDIIGYLPVHCSMPEAASYVEAHLKQYPVEDIRRLHTNAVRWNDVEIPKQQTAELITSTLDDVSRASRAPKGQLIFPPSGAIRRRAASK